MGYNAAVHRNFAGAGWSRAYKARARSVIFLPRDNSHFRGAGRANVTGLRHTFAMRRCMQSMFPMFPMLWIVAFALLAVRVSDAHLHLCFDGQEPRSSFHVSGHAVHHAPTNHSDEHVDADISLAATMAAKVAKIDSDDAAVLPVSLQTPQFFSLPAAVLPAFRAGITPTIRGFLRPPLRGPPR